MIIMAKKTQHNAEKKLIHRHVVKRRGHLEKFDDRKVYASAYAAALSAHLSERRAEDIASKVCVAICKWVQIHTMVTAHMLYEQLVRELRKHDKNAAFMYETHTDIS